MFVFTNPVVQCSVSIGAVCVSILILRAAAITSISCKLASALKLLAGRQHNPLWQNLDSSVEGY